MTRAVVSMAAVLVLLASFATPSSAQRGTLYSAEGTKFRISATVSDTEVNPGDVITITGRITTFADGTSSRKPLAFAIVSPTGEQRTGIRAIAPGRSKSMTKSFTIPANTPPGTYEGTVAAQYDGEPLIINIAIRVGER
jgi:uncharacterized membrane protein